jgi:hypothetical protein
MLKHTRTLLFWTLAGGATAFGADFLPLASGNSWVYRDARTGSEFTVDVGATQTVNQRVYYALRGYTPQQLLVRANEFGNIVYWDGSKQTDVLLISFEVVPGGRFAAPARACEEDGQVQDKRVTHNGPAGTWSALEIQYRTFGCADAGDLSEQFVENIGMVRRVVTTFAGPRAFDLVYARVGNQAISAGSTGSFSVSATPGVSTITAALRIQQPLGTQLRLHFWSGQEYDLRLRDSTGRVLYTWSADKLFLQAQHELLIAGSWSVNVSLPQPPATPEGPHVYTIEAWLTTAENDPTFAAATTVEIPGTAVARAARAR